MATRAHTPDAIDKCARDLRRRIVNQTCFISAALTCDHDERPTPTLDQLADAYALLVRAEALIRGQAA